MGYINFFTFDFRCRNSRRISLVLVHFQHLQNGESIKDKKSELSVFTWTKVKDDPWTYEKLPVLLPLTTSPFSESKPFYSKPLN